MVLVVEGRGSFRQVKDPRDFRPQVLVVQEPPTDLLVYCFSGLAERCIAYRKSKRSAEEQKGEPEKTWPSLRPKPQELEANVMSTSCSNVLWPIAWRALQTPLSVQALLCLISICFWPRTNGRLQATCTSEVSEWVPKISRSNGMRGAEHSLGSRLHERFCVRGRVTAAGG